MERNSPNWLLFSSSFRYMDQVTTPARYCYWWLNPSLVWQRCIFHYKPLHTISEWPSANEQSIINEFDSSKNCFLAMSESRDSSWEILLINGEVNKFNESRSEYYDCFCETFWNVLQDSLLHWDIVLCNI